MRRSSTRSTLWLNTDIEDKKLPGAVVLVGHKGKIVFRKAYGNRSLVPTVEKMTVDTIFDVASLTKVVATTTSIMILVEQGKLRLNDTIGKFIPDIDDEQAKSVTIQQLLTHTSGLRARFRPQRKMDRPRRNARRRKKKNCERRRGRSLFIRISDLLCWARSLTRVSRHELSKDSFDVICSEQKRSLANRGWDIH